MESAPIFVTGYRRSGTTLLGNVIDRHPAIAVFVESFFIPRYYYTQTMFWPLRREANFLRLARSITGEEPARQNHLTLDEGQVRSIQERTLPALVDALLTEWARGRGKERWADKSPGYITKMPVLARMFPDARFIHIIRDGRDVWLSLKNLRWEKDVVKVAGDWARSVVFARSWASRLGDRYLEVRYERLVAHPEEEARRITDFLGAPYAPAMIEPDEGGPGNPALVGWPNVDRAIDPGNTKKWMGRLDERERAAFHFCARGLLQTLGYDVPADRYAASQRWAVGLGRLRARVQRPFQVLTRASRLFARALAGRMK